MARDTRKPSTHIKHIHPLDVLELIVATALTVAVIIRHDLAIHFACCYLMGRQVGYSIFNLKQP